LNVVDPFRDYEDAPPKLPHTVKFSKTKIKGGILPGGYQYFHVWQPSHGGPRQGRELLTDNKQFYLRIHIDHYENIDEVTYFGKDVVELENLSRLVGLPHSYLNQIWDR
jgi:hypothetical protein